MDDEIIPVQNIMIYCNRKNMKYGTTYIAHLRVNDGVNADEAEKILSIKNESEE